MPLTKIGEAIGLLWAAEANNHIRLESHGVSGGDKITNTRTNRSIPRKGGAARQTLSVVMPSGESAFVRVKVQ